MTQTNKKSLSMRAKIFIYFASFALFAIALIWVFETVFLNDVYSSIKMKTLVKATEAVADSVGNDTETVANEIADRNRICVSVYEISNGMAHLEYQAHADTNCILHNIAASSNTILNRMYDGAKTADVYTAKFAEGNGAVVSDSDNTVTSVISSALRTVDGATYLILLNTEMIPVTATVDTLRALLVVVTVILILASAIIAFVLSARISKPVGQMSTEARKLARGDYNVSFPEKTAFTETNELGSTLNYAAKELSCLDSMQKELIANISHDIRTPLTMISGYSEVMRDIPGENTPENMQVIIDETKRLSSLVSDMLDLSRLTGGGSKLNKTEFSLTSLVAETMKRYSHLTERDGYKITFESDADVSVFADEIKITQVIYNLINNAVNYTGDDKTVTVKQTVTDGTVRISVTDTGDGIPDDKLPMIWERYYRTGDFHKRPVIGTGLGLPIVKNCLLLHGARFGVSSEVGLGSTFWFELETIK